MVDKVCKLVSVLQSEINFKEYMTEITKGWLHISQLISTKKASLIIAIKKIFQIIYFVILGKFSILKNTVIKKQVEVVRFMPIHLYFFNTVIENTL